MESKDSDLEMEVDSPGTFSQEQGEIVCDEKSQNMCEKNVSKSCDDSKGSSQINDCSPYDSLSESFMKLSVQDESSFSLDGHGNRQANISKPSSTVTYRQECTEEQPVKPLHSYKIGNCVTRSPGILTTLLIVPEAENDSFNTARVDKDDENHLVIHRSGKTPNLDECLPHNAKGNGGCCDHDHIYSSLLLKIANNIGNISAFDSSLMLKEITHVNSLHDNSSTTLKEKGYGTHSLHTNSPPTVKEKVQYDGRLCAHSSSTLKSKDHGVSSFPYALPSSQNVDNCLVNNKYVDSSSIKGYEKQSQCRETAFGSRELIYKEEKDVQVYKSDRYAKQIVEGTVIDCDQEQRTEFLEVCCLQENAQDKWNQHFKQNTGQSKDRNLQKSLKSSGKQEPNSEFVEIPQLSREVLKRHGIEKTMQEETLKLKNVENESLGKSNRRHGHYSKQEQQHHCEEVYPHTGDEKILQKHKNVCDDARKVKKPDLLKINGAIEHKNYLKGNNIRDIVEEAKFNEVKIYKKDEGTEHNSSKIGMCEVDKQPECSVDSEKVHCEPNQKEEIQMKQVRQSSEELWSQKKCPSEKELEQRLSRCEPNQKEEIQMKQVRQSSEELRSQKKCPSEKELQQRLSNLDNDHRNRYERNIGEGESHHQRRKGIHRRRQESSTSDSSNDDIDECLNKGSHGDKWDGTRNLLYRKLSWESYLKMNQHVGEWDQDCSDPFDQTLARYIYGAQQMKKFYRDYDRYAHHDNVEIRGWNNGEFVFIGEVSKCDNERVEVYPESSCHKREDELTPAGGAIRKTYLRDEQRNLQRSKIDTESDLEYGSSTESTKRLIHGLPPALLTEDETDSCDEREGHFWSGRTGLQHQNQYTDNISVSTSKSSDIAKPTESEVKSCVPYSSLVKYLTLCKNFSSDIGNLLRKFSLFENVKKLVLERPDVFTVCGSVVELRPKISLCEEFLSSGGCQNKLSCTKLHICEVFMINMCSDSNCSYGHNVCTTHNKRVLQSFWMDNLEASAVIDVLRLTLLGTVNIQPLDICSNYNFSTCQNDNCKDLHICVDYVGGLGSCVRPSCSLNHDIQEQNCMAVLFSHGIDITHLEEEEQLLAVIQESIKITQLVQGYESQGQMQKIFELGYQRLQSSPNSKTCPNQKEKLNGIMSSKPLHTTGISSAPLATNKNSKGVKYSEPTAKTPSNKVTSSPSNQGNSSKGSSVDCKSLGLSYESENKSNNFSFKYITSAINNKIHDIFPPVYTGNEKNPKIVTKFSTVWSSYANGDVEVEEICYYSVNTVCKFESSGCRRLHAHTEFQWQMKVSKTVSWINLQPDQVFHLEQKYTDPNIEITELPPPHAKESPLIVHLILKDEKHYANLKELKLVNSITFEVYDLRRLHMQDKNKNSSYNQFLWYCKDIAGKWILYGNADSSGDPHSAAKIKSQDIEKKYLSNEPKFHFKNSKGTMQYTLDFKKMVQVNRATGKEREVRRRPRPQIFNSVS
ncbi:uncharacterized protein LOC135216466 isoform X2 [Macrobrachium nipponense]|uniref:uncharacterized protein LOC135216466 isoform X2 n=1 Tax=Macrobrachium nipponense TaxID=159736 RepID=UPI0030C7BAA4